MLLMLLLLTQSAKLARSRWPHTNMIDTFRFQLPSNSLSFSTFNLNFLCFYFFSQINWQTGNNTARSLNLLKLVTCVCVCALYFYSALLDFVCLLSLGLARHLSLLLLFSPNHQISGWSPAQAQAQAQSNKSLLLLLRKTNTRIRESHLFSFSSSFFQNKSIGDFYFLIYLFFHMLNCFFSPTNNKQKRHKHTQTHAHTEQLLSAPVFTRT